MTTPIKVLLIEDNPGDIELVRAGFEDASLLIEMQVISDGQEAFDYFEQDNQTPDIVLLDINLPKVSGIEILKKIRNSHAESIPVVMLTSSDAEIDIARSYAEHANSFISKPVDFDKFLGVIKSIEDFWLTIVKLPPQSLPR